MESAQEDFSGSSNKDRSISNVVFEHEPLILGPLLPQHSKDFDMTYEAVKGCAPLMTAYSVLDFDKQITDQHVEQEYRQLDHLFDSQKVEKNLLASKIY